MLVAFQPSDRRRKEGKKWRGKKAMPMQHTKEPVAAMESTGSKDNAMKRGGGSGKNRKPSLSSLHEKLGRTI